MAPTIVTISVSANVALTRASTPRRTRRPTDPAEFPAADPGRPSHASPNGRRTGDGRSAKPPPGVEGPPGIAATVVDMTRRRLAAVTVVLLAAALAALAGPRPAAAVGNGFDPAAAPVRVPTGGQEVTEWKLAGKGSASGVQIAPQWILTSGHAPIDVGGTFTNAYGSSTVDRVVACGGAGSGCDVSVSHLAAALPAPGFPDLLLDGVPSEVGRDVAGDVLAVGMGGSPLGRPTAGWTVPSGYTLSTLLNGPSAVTGDSGGLAFYYRPGATTGQLLGPMVYASYDVSVYAVSHQAGPSLPATAVGMGPGL
jgi:hypothetical protein